MDKLAAVVQKELSKMLVRGVDYSPAAEDLPSVTRVMIDDLIRLGLTDQDASRVEQAFSTVALHIGRWPTAFMIRENLPKRSDQNFRRLESPGTPVSPEVAKQNIERIRKMIAESIDIFHEKKAQGGQ